MTIHGSLIKAGIAAAALLCGAQAFALTITPAGPGLVGTTDDNSNCEPGCFPAAVGDTTDWDLLYKDNVGGGEEGLFAGSYETSYQNEPLDPQDALIEYVAAPALVCDALYKCILVVKDGNQTPAQYFFDLFTAGWNGTDDLYLQGFWPNNGAISHVSIWGGPGHEVPEPGTLGLLGLSLLGLGVIRGRRRSR